jgi:nitrous oxidase accessory protein
MLFNSFKNYSCVFLNYFLENLFINLFLIIFLFCNVNNVSASNVITVSEGANLNNEVYKANIGDILLLSSGKYNGPIVINKPLQLIGEEETIIQGAGKGSVITVSAPDVKIKNLKITGSGNALETMDSGIFIDKSGDRATVEENYIFNNLFGVYLWGPKDAIVNENKIIGMTEGHVNGRGNGVSLWNSPGSIIKNNNISFGRDGIFSTSSKNNIFKNNNFKDTRIAIHYMYTNNSEIINNHSENNHVGYALMFSRNLLVEENKSINDRDHGILLNFANKSIIKNNIVENGKNKCVFIYNSNKNKFIRNSFTGCLIGIHFTAGSEKNIISYNSFIKNKTQVKYVGSKNLNWSFNGKGNFWSDNPSFDLNGDGISDTIYRPNNLIDEILWTYPTSKLLLNSPAIQALRWSQKMFPTLLPGGVTDNFPLMKPPKITVSTIKKIVSTE